MFFNHHTDFLRPGTNDPMPGLIGRAYAEMGGTVHYVGKPHPAVYQACFQALALAANQVNYYTACDRTGQHRYTTHRKHGRIGRTVGNVRRMVANCPYMLARAFSLKIGIVDGS